MSRILRRVAPRSLDLFRQPRLAYGASSSTTVQRPLDGITGGLAGYSTRKLRTAYAGSAIRVDRSNDHAQQDIGFASDGSLDIASLATFVGANDGRVVTWYDQVGTTDATLAVTNAPRIRNSSTNEVINSTRPAVYFDSTFYLDTALASVPTNVRRIFVAATVDNVASTYAMVGGTNTGGLVFRTETNSTLGLLKGFTANIGNSSGTITAATASICEASYDGTNYTFYIDGAASGSGATAQAIVQNVRLGSESAGAGVASGQFLGHIGEIIIVDKAGDLSAANRQSIEANMKAYWGTP